jgi:two-component system, cell cycle sensor histidine kinase PleC
MVSLLLAAFAGALGLKAWDERQTSDAAILSNQMRLAEDLSGRLEAELAGTRARLETLLKSGASIAAIDRMGDLSAAEADAPPGGHWAHIGEDGVLGVFVQAPGGQWITVTRTSEGVLPPLAAGESIYFADAGSASSAGFEPAGWDRVAAACAPVNGSDTGLCVQAHKPLLTQDDIFSLAIYALLIAAPGLAVFGLLQALGRAAPVAPSSTARPRVADTAHRADLLAEIEVSGLIGVWRLDPAAQTLSLGKEAAALLGLNGPIELPVNEFLPMVAEDDRSRVHAALTRPNAMAQINLSFKGSVRTGARYLELFGGAANGRFTGVLLNASDRVHAQQRSRRAEMVAHTAIETHPGPFAIWDNRRRLTHWNAAFVREFGLDPESLHAGASYDEITAAVNKSVRIERPLGDETGAREMHLHSGRWLRVTDRRTPQDGMITVATDITHLKQQELSLSRNERKLRTMVTELERTEGQARELATRLDELKSRAEHASQAKSVFLASMSHELHTPLNIINGFSEMMIKEVHGPLDARYRSYSEDILDQGNALLLLIDDLLDMAKVESGKMKIQPELLDITEPVDAAIRLVRRRAMDRGLSIVFDPDDDLPDIKADHRAIKQMALNLLNNAVKFTEPGGQVRATIFQEGDWILFRVQDTGCGIAPEDLPNLGQPFVQGQAPDGRTRRGTGLGLALTKSFTEMHGGKISIESTVGVGTTVTIQLPVKADDSPHSVAA